MGGKISSPLPPDKGNEEYDVKPQQPPEHLPDTTQPNQAIYMSEALVQRITRKTGSASRPEPTRRSAGSPGRVHKASSQEDLRRSYTASAPPKTPPPEELPPSYPDITNASLHGARERGDHSHFSDNFPSASSARASVWSENGPSNASESMQASVHDIVQTQVDAEIARDMRVKDKLSSSLRSRLREFKAVDMDTSSRIITARNALKSCYSANPGNPIVCAPAVQMFTETVNTALGFVDTS